MNKLGCHIFSLAGHNSLPTKNQSIESSNEYGNCNVTFYQYDHFQIVLQAVYGLICLVLQNSQHSQPDHRPSATSTNVHSTILKMQNGAVFITKPTGDHVEVYWFTFFKLKCT